MKKLLLCVLMACSASAFAAPCWLTVGGYTVSAGLITHMFVLSNTVYIYFGEQAIGIGVPSAAAGQKVIADIVAQSRACK